MLKKCGCIYMYMEIHNPGHSFPKVLFGGNRLSWRSRLSDIWKGIFGSYWLVESHRYFFYCFIDWGNKLYPQTLVTDQFFQWIDVFRATGGFFTEGLIVWVTNGKGEWQQCMQLSMV